MGEVMSDVAWFCLALALLFPAFCICYGLVAWALALCRAGLTRMFRR